MSNCKVISLELLAVCCWLTCQHLLVLLRVEQEHVRLQLRLAFLQSVQCPGIGQLLLRKFIQTDYSCVWT